MNLKLFVVILMAFAAAAAEADMFALVRANDVAGIRAAIASGAGANAADKIKATPLMHAAAFGSIDAMRILLDAGAKVNASSTGGSTALMWAAGSLPRMRLLVDRGANVNAVSAAGRTALMAAAGQPESLALVEYLLDHKADARMKDATGGTALNMAASGGDVRTVRLLLDKGLDANNAGINGRTPLLFAAQAGNLPIVRLLLESGANPNATTKYGQPGRHGPVSLAGATALMLAAPYASPELVKALLDGGASINAVDCRGMTALMFAVASDDRDPRTLDLLLSRGAEVNVKSIAGETALDWAMRFNDPVVIALLRRHNAGTAVAPNGHTPKPEPAANAKQAVARAAALVQATSTSFFNESGCTACHAQNLTQVTQQRLGAIGLVDAKMAAEQTRQLTLRELQERLLLRIDPPTAEIALYQIFGLAASEYKPDLTTDSIVHYLLSVQTPEGGWVERGQPRPPMNSSHTRRTAMALRALRTYSLPGRRAEFEESFARARGWLSKYRPVTSSDRVWLVAALEWAGSGASNVRKAAGAVKADQRPDGGWAQTKFLGSDAFATGEALWVLHETGQLEPRDAAYGRAADYLMRTQMADGSWHVRSRAIKFQPYFQSGFPHDHDQWISEAASAWATAALSPVANMPVKQAGPGPR